MTRRQWATLLYAALAALYVLHNDVWLWNDSRLWLGLPAGLVYHIGFCVVTSAVLGLMVVYAWPPGVPLSGGQGARETTRIPPPPRGQGEHG
ncbi:MAG TPA: hypothetical protein VHG32_05090 [Thermoanaerobaculia bacterium]|jgi:hypothetical protein|nr:hypothetical protein [Thermoanaerobaculia bacterium]